MKGATRTALALLLALLALTAGAPPDAHAASPFARVVRARPTQRTTFNFDWDDNAVHMVTRLHLVSRTGRADLPVSTEQFALIKHQLGKPGPYADYMVGSPDHTFRETTRRGYFAKQLVETIKARPEVWQGKSWPRLVEALSSRSTAKQVTIITARASDPREIMAGLMALKRAGMIKHLPKLENIFSVENQDAQFEGKVLVGTTGEKKATVMLGLLRRLEKAPLPRQGVTLRSPDGARYATSHLWGFSDDDWDNYEAARRVLAEHAHEFPHVKIKVMFTGDHPEHAPETVIVHGGTWRPLLPEEQGETAQIRGTNQMLSRLRLKRWGSTAATRTAPSASDHSATSAP